MKYLITLLLAICIIGCHPASAPTPPLAPGALNSFDQTSYTALMTAQASLNSLKASVQGNSSLSSLTVPLNQAIADYDIAQTAWELYHASATTANEAVVTTALTKVQTDVTNLNSAVSK